MQKEPSYDHSNSLDVFSINLFLWWAFETTVCETLTLFEKEVRSELSSSSKLLVSFPRKCLAGHEALVLNIHLDVWAELWKYRVKHFSVPSNCTVMFHSIKRFALFSSLCYKCVFEYILPFVNGISGHSVVFEYGSYRSTSLQNLYVGIWDILYIEYEPIYDRTKIYKPFLNCYHTTGSLELSVNIII